MNILYSTARTQVWWYCVLCFLLLLKRDSTNTHTRGRMKNVSTWCARHVWQTAAFCFALALFAHFVRKFTLISPSRARSREKLFILGGAHFFSFVKGAWIVCGCVSVYFNSKSVQCAWCFSAIVKNYKIMSLGILSFTCFYYNPSLVI